MKRWRKIQPVVMLVLAAYVVTRGIVALTEGRTGSGLFQVISGVVVAVIVMYESTVLEPRRRARQERQRRR